MRAMLFIRPTPPLPRAQPPLAPSLLALAAALCAGAALAQGAAPAPSTAPAAEPPPVPAPAEPVPQRVEVTGERTRGDLQQRRESTAAKIVVGREEIERFGDASLGDVLKRLPGVTLDGAPGRGGNPRLRGLGSGYTQVLLDGEAVPRGFDISSLAPEQIERIEILRAPTAETGARAIAGTLNIVLRETQPRRFNQLRLALGQEHGRGSPEAVWTRNGEAGAMGYTFTLNAGQTLTSAESASELVREADGAAPLHQQENASAHNRRDRVMLNGRLQWRLGEGERFTLTPFLIHSRSLNQRHATLAQPSDPATVPWTQADTETLSRFTLARLSGQRTQRLADGTRLEWRAGAGGWQWHSDATRLERGGLTGSDPTVIQDATRTEERSWNASVKASRLLADAHSGVAGLELEGARRTESAQRGVSGPNPQGSVQGLADLADNLQARSQRIAAYAQDEWELSRAWAVHGGLRWETIETRGDAGTGAQANRSAVWSPLLHLLWKPDPKSRDQLRLSLTRSYRSPSLGSLIARPSVNSLNAPTRPDRSGNPELRPELATGLDAAWEHYLPGGGFLGASVFHREVGNLIRTLTSLEPSVPWAAGPRWVSRPVNVGDATVQGLELEAKLALRELLRAGLATPDASAAAVPAVDLRGNLGLYRSRVKSVPGPDNRLDQQPGLTANLGADWKPRGWPLTLGANLNWTPPYTVQLSTTERVRVGRKPVFDAYALWTVSPTLALRLNATNLGAPDVERASAFTTAGFAERSSSVSRSWTEWTLRLEMKL